MLGNVSGLSLFKISIQHSTVAVGTTMLHDVEMG